MNYVKTYLPKLAMTETNNTPTLTIRHLLNHTSGLSYESAMEKFIFTPLRMYDTTATAAGYITAENRASPHLKLCGINSTIANMSNWLRAQMGAFREIISDINCREVQHRHISTSLPQEIKLFPGLADNRITNVFYGLGWRIFDYMGKSVMYHGGKVSGFSNAIAFMPTEKIGIVILTNSETPFPQILIATFFDMYLDLPQKDWSKLTLAQHKSLKKRGS